MVDRTAPTCCCTRWDRNTTGSALAIPPTRAAGDPLASSRHPHTAVSHHHRRVSLLKNFERKSCNSLFWSPSGGILLVANLKGTSGQLEWIDVNVSLPNSNHEPMAR